MGKLLKRAVFALFVLAAAPFIALAWLEQRLSKGEAVFVFGSQCLALVPGRPGTYVRAAYYWATLADTSWETHVGFGSVFMHRGACLKQYASMGAYCVIGHAHIGERVMMGSRVSIPSGRRQHLDEQGQLSEHGRFDTVTIGNGTWVGEGAIIMADVGAQCIVSSGAVVAREVADHLLIGGNPARVIKELAAPAGGSSRD